MRRVAIGVIPRRRGAGGCSPTASSSMQCTAAGICLLSVAPKLPMLLTRFLTGASSRASASEVGNYLLADALAWFRGPFARWAGRDGKGGSGQQGLPRASEGQQSTFRAQKGLLFTR